MTKEEQATLNYLKERSEFFGNSAHGVICGEAATLIESLAKENDELRKDKERLDWLRKNNADLRWDDTSTWACCIGAKVLAISETPSQSIDSAMQAHGQSGKKE